MTSEDGDLHLPDQARLLGLVAAGALAAVTVPGHAASTRIAEPICHGDPAIEEFRRRVADALIAGDYRAVQCIYVAQGHDNFLRFGRACAWGGSGKRYLCYSAPHLREPCQRTATALDANR